MNTYTCEMCGGTFGKAWTDEEAVTEYKATFSLEAERAEPCSVLCQVCYDRIMAVLTKFGKPA